VQGRDDSRAFHGVERRRVERATHDLAHRAAAVDRTSEAIDHAPEQAGADRATLGHFLSHDGVALAYALGLAQEHHDRAAVTEPNDLAQQGRTHHARVVLESNQTSDGKREALDVNAQPANRGDNTDDSHRLHVTQSLAYDVNDHACGPPSVSGPRGMIAAAIRSS
jgi:hypothetical protein